MDSTLFHGDLVTSKRILYTPSGFAKQNLMYLQEIGELEANRPHTSERHDLASFLLMIVQKGTGTLLYGGKAYHLYPGDCVFIDCHTGYSHTTSDKLWSLRWIHFSGPTMDSIYEKYADRGGKPAFRLQSNHVLCRKLDKIYDLAACSDYIRDMRINEEISSILTIIMEQSWNPDFSGRPISRKSDIQNIQLYLDQHYREKLSLDQLAAQFYVSKFYLAHAFKNSTGLTVLEYLQTRRVTHAKRLLRFSSMTVEQIGIDCGIEDPNYFSRTFRKIEGISPAKYRKMWIN